MEKAILRLRNRLTKQEALRDELKDKHAKAQKARLEAELAAKQKAADAEATDIAALEAQLAQTGGG